MNLPTRGAPVRTRYPLIMPNEAPLPSNPDPREKFELRWEPHKLGCLQPGVVLEDRNILFDLMEDRP